MKSNHLLRSAIRLGLGAGAGAMAVGAMPAAMAQTAADEPLDFFMEMPLASDSAPLVLRLLYLAFKDRFDAHRRLARWTYPIWLYVSVTGIVVYVLLYHVYGYR